MMDQNQIVGVGTVAGSLRWEIARLLWIGHFKEQQWCIFAKLPQELIRVIIQFASW